MWHIHRSKVMESAKIQKSSDREHVPVYAVQGTIPNGVKNLKKQSQGG